MVQVNNKASEQNGNDMSSFLTLKKLMPNALGTALNMYGWWCLSLGSTMFLADPV